MTIEAHSLPSSSDTVVPQTLEDLARLVRERIVHTMQVHDLMMALIMDGFLDPVTFVWDAELHTRLERQLSVHGVRIDCVTPGTPTSISMIRFVAVGTRADVVLSAASLLTAESDSLLRDLDQGEERYTRRVRSVEAELRGVLAKLRTLGDR